MKETLSQERIEEISHSIRSFCLARTSCEEDAEDLQQDILLEITRSMPSLRDNRAFYGFMWSVARHVYRRFCQRRARNQHLPLTEQQEDELMAPPQEEDENVARLRRELTLLSARFRAVTIAHYMENQTCAQIAERLSISESMVKYLLFKSRSLLKEGMTMERTLGKQSYQPRKIHLGMWSNCSNERYHNKLDSLTAQNILFACYHDNLTPEEISLEIGVGLPYMESELQSLTECGLLYRQGDRYRTEIILFTQEFQTEMHEKSKPLVQRIASLIKEGIAAKEQDIRALGFAGADMNVAAFRWQMALQMLSKAVVDDIDVEIPLNSQGENIILWGAEADQSVDQFAFGTSNIINDAGDQLKMLDLPILSPRMTMEVLRGAAAGLYLQLARGVQPESESDHVIAAEIKKKGYLREADGKLAPACPVMTRAQYTALLQMLSPWTQAITEEALRIRQTAEQLLADQVPSHLKSQAKNIAYFQIFDEAISAPLASLYGESYLMPKESADWMPATMVVLK